MDSLIKGRNAKRYAFSIHTNNTQKQKEKELDFTQLNNGFYDQLLSCDKILKRNTKALLTLKSKSIKESIYSNKNIPNGWKKKGGYFGELYKTINNDQDFMKYLGLTKQNSATSINRPTVPIMSNLKENTIPKETENEINESQPKNPIITKKTSIITRRGLNNNITQLEDERMIGEILKEYRTVYPIRLKNEDKEPLPQVTMYRSSTISPYNNNRSSLGFSKSDVFRSTMYTNLVQNERLTQENQNKTPHPHSKHKMSRNQSQKDVYGPFLNINYDYKKTTEITNPKIKQKLIDIRYYGPYYSHCHSCQNKNLNFYENMGQGECIRLLNHLKKTRVKIDKIITSKQ